MTIRNIEADWRFLPSTSVAPTLHRAIGGNPLVATVLVQRGYVTVEQAEGFLDPAKYRPTPPGELVDLELAVDLLQGCIAARNPILIWGDFDVDGQTATALLLDGLHRLGADVDFYIPHRLRESHGIPVQRLSELVSERRPALLLTCDTGISETEAIDYARQLGIPVVVTDHHDLPAELPAASAIVNPKRQPPKHPLRTLPGVGVAYKLMEALFTKAGIQGELARLLDLVALGIVADVAEQIRDTRYLLQLGLEQLRHTTRSGLQALIEQAGLQQEFLTAEDIGFQLGPRLNAAGRLGDATQAVELLTTTDPVQAQVIAANLDGLNKQRRVMQRQILAAAQEQIALQPDLLDHTALVLQHPAWHPGLLGIVAGQLAERYQRPCILLLAPEDDVLARGSARSVPGYHIGQAIAAQAALLHTYGGHAGAAGLSLPVDNIAQFRRRLSRTLEENIQAEAAPPLTIAAELPLQEITPELTAEIHRLAPFGEGNPPVLLAAKNLTLAKSRTLGREGLHRKLVVQDATATRRDVLWWSGADHPLPEGTFDLAFSLGWNTYQGQREMALILEALHLHTPVSQRPAPQLSIEDWRENLAPQDVIASFRCLEPEGIIWAEGSHSTDLRTLSVAHFTRQNIMPADAILIYTAPPGSQLLRSVLAKTAPARLYVAGLTPDAQETNTFLKRLAGLVKYTITNKDGRIDLDALAGATAQTTTAVHWGLRFLAANGHLWLEDSDETLLVRERGGTPPPSMADEAADAAQEATEIIRAQLAEAAAYRAFFSRVPVDGLLT